MSWAPGINPKEKVMEKLVSGKWSTGQLVIGKWSLRNYEQ